MTETIEQLTEEQLENEQVFAAAPVEEIPDTYCIGTITKMNPAVVSKKGVYLYAAFELTASPGTSGIDTKAGLTIRPEWFVKGFDPKELSTKKGENTQFVYNSNMVPAEKSKSNSVLQGLCYNRSRFNQIARALQATTANGIEAPGWLDEFNAVLVDAVTPEGKPAVDADGDRLEVIYCLTQRTEKNEITGKREIVPGLQFANFQWKTDETMAYLTKRAEEKGDIRLTWLKGE